MAAWEFVLWGLVGGLLVEGVDFLTVVRALGTPPWAGLVPPDRGPTDGARPMRPSRGAYVACLVVRAALGAVLATAMGLSGQLDTPVVTLMIGAAAPVMITRFAAAATATPPARVETPDAGPLPTGPDGGAGLP